MIRALVLATLMASALETTIALAESCFEKDPNDAIACLYDSNGWPEELLDTEDFTLFSDNLPSRGGTWMKTPADLYLERYRW